MLAETQRPVDRLIIGCGYLGFKVAKQWLKQGLRVAVTTRSQEKKTQFHKLGLQPILCDVLDRDSLLALPHARIVLHSVAVDRSSGQSMKSVYLDGTQNLLSVVQERCDHFFYISSTSVYGQSAGEIITEQSACEPLRENGQICLEAENRVCDSQVDSLILRLAGLYGPGRLIARMNQAKQALPIPGNPDAWLNLVHVDDCVAAILAACEIDSRKETILISDDLPIPRRDYYSLLAKLMQAPPPLFAVDQKDPKGERGSGKRCNNRKMHQLLIKDFKFPTIYEGLPDAISAQPEAS